MIESIKLQRDFHAKHIDLIRLKKSQYEKYKLAVEQQRLKNADFLEQRLVKDRIESVCDLQISIFKTLDESDNLLDALNNAGKSPGRVSLNSDSGSNTIVEYTNENSAETKSKKSDNSLIDDLHTLNHQLHILVYNMVTRCDQSQHELETMRERIKSLEKDRNLRKSSLPNSNKSSTDSAKTDESPTSAAERENQRSSVSGEERKIVLPESSDLPPLELPEFDYSTFDDK